jgi:hypothetical protein
LIGTGSSLRTQTQYERTHCEGPAVVAPSAKGVWGLRSCLMYKRYAQGLVAATDEIAVDKGVTGWRREVF